MIQFNLLPEAKLQNAGAEKKRRLITSVAVLVSIVSVCIFALTFFAVNVVQTKQLNDSSKEVNQLLTQIKKIDGLDKVLTIQNQLQTLATLHQNKHITSRIFTYLPQVTPTTVHIGHLSLDTTTNTLNIDGTADSQHSVNTFIDTLKFTTWSVSSQSGQTSAFPSVVETSFSLVKGNANYSISAKFDPALFSNTFRDSQGRPEAPKLNVPSLTTTRSVLNDPANVLFNGQNTGEQNINQ